MPPQSYVYIVTSKKNGTLYTGVTTNLLRRIWEHKNNITKGFTQKYNIHTLVYYEIHETITEAIQREKQIKHWKREYRINTIEKENPEWKDLYNDLVEI
jgi:putative endonuclease